jgi:hypothetical protein
LLQIKTKHISRLNVKDYLLCGLSSASPRTKRLAAVKQAQFSHELSFNVYIVTLLAVNEQIMAKPESDSELCYDRRSVGQSVWNKAPIFGVGFAVIQKAFPPG